MTARLLKACYLGPAGREVQVDETSYARLKAVGYAIAMPEKAVQEKRETRKRGRPRK